jgi:hypothetical protein
VSTWLIIVLESSHAQAPSSLTNTNLTSCTLYSIQTASLYWVISFEYSPAGQ